MEFYNPLHEIPDERQAQTGHSDVKYDAFRYAWLFVSTGKKKKVWLSFIHYQTSRQSSQASVTLTLGLVSMEPSELFSALDHPGPQDKVEREREREPASVWGRAARRLTPSSPRRGSHWPDLISLERGESRLWWLQWMKESAELILCLTPLTSIIADGG